MRRRTDDADYVLEDGETIRCPVQLMDGMQRAIADVDLSHHRPGYVQLTDEQIAMRRAARDGYVQRLRDSWKTRPADVEFSSDLKTRPEPAAATERRRLTDAEAERDRAWEEMRRRLASAWQTGRTDPGVATRSVAGGPAARDRA